jgi:hypothetical protein
MIPSVGRASPRSLGPLPPAGACSSSIFLDKNRRGIGTSQSTWTAHQRWRPPRSRGRVVGSSSRRWSGRRGGWAADTTRRACPGRARSRDLRASACRRSAARKALAARAGRGRGRGRVCQLSEALLSVERGGTSQSLSHLPGATSQQQL